jgi:hypothetical protein
VLVEHASNSVIGYFAVAPFEAHDFEPLPDNPHRLVMKLSTAARALDVPWP